GVTGGVQVGGSAQFGQFGGQFGQFGQVGGHPSAAPPGGGGHFGSAPPLPPRRPSYEELAAQRLKVLKERKKQEKVVDLPLADGIESLALDASRIGEGFHKLVDQKVSVPRQASTLLPLHRGPVEVTRFSLFNTRTHPRFPLHSVKLKNTT